MMANYSDRMLRHANAKRAPYGPPGRCPACGQSGPTVVERRADRKPRSVVLYCRCPNPPVPEALEKPTR